MTLRVSGGEPPYQFRFLANRSGARLTPSSTMAEYAPGTRDLVADVIEVRDAHGETIISTIAVDPGLLLDPPVVHVHPGGTV